MYSLFPRFPRMRLQCFYVYEAPHLTIASFNTILESCPNLKQFGNLSRWAVNCEGIQQIGRPSMSPFLIRIRIRRLRHFINGSGSDASFHKWIRILQSVNKKKDSFCFTYFLFGAELF